MKKIIAGLLCVVLLFSVSVSAYAAPKQKHNGMYKIPYGIAKKMNNTTKFEAILMALRINNYTEELEQMRKEILKGLENFDWDNCLEDIAYGYLDLAQEKGILTDKEVREFKPLSYVKRYEIVKYVIRALGYEEEAQEAMDEELKFKDSNVIPDDCIGYIYMATKLNIISGYPDNTFQPYENVTRTQLALIMEKIYYLLEYDMVQDIDEYTTYKGKVIVIDDEEVVIEINNGLKKFEIDEEVRIIYNGKSVNIEDIKVNDVLTIKVNKEYEILLINIADREQKYFDYEGELIQIDKDKDYIIIKTKKEEKLKIFYLNNYLKVYINKNRAQIKDLKLDDYIQIRVNKYNKVIEIKIERELKYYGRVVKIEDDSLTILVNNKTEKFSLDKYVNIKYHNDIKADKKDIKVGDKVTILVNYKDKIILIKMDKEYVFDEVKGEIDDIKIYANTRGYVYIKEKNSSIKRYRITSDSKIYLNTKVAQLSDLMVKDNVVIKINKDNIVSYIYAERDEVSYTGIVKLINKDYIGILINNNLKVFKLSEDVKVILNNNKIGNLSDIKSYDNVNITINNKALVIKVKKVNNDEIKIIESYLFEINIQNNYIITKNRKGQLEAFVLDKNVKVMIKNQEKDIKNLIKGNKLKLFINKENKIFLINVN